MLELIILQKKIIKGLLIVIFTLYIYPYILFPDESNDNIDNMEALIAYRKAIFLRQNQRLEEALIKLQFVIEKIKDNKILASAYIEIAYIEYLKGKHPSIYGKYFEIVYNLKSFQAFGESYDKEFKDEYAKILAILQKKEKQKTQKGKGKHKNPKKK